MPHRSRRQSKTDARRKARRVRAVTRRAQTGAATRSGVSSAVRVEKLTSLAISARSSTAHLPKPERDAYLAARQSIAEAREAADRMVVAAED